MNYNDFIINSDDISSTEKIFECVSKIASRIKSGITVAPIIFSKNIKNINPLFFILLFAEKRKRKIKYAIDVTMLEKFQQHSIQHILRQRLDLALLDLETKRKRNFSEIFSEPNIYNRIDLYLSKEIVKDTLFVTKDATEYAISLNIHKINGYSQLPIMALRNLGYFTQKIKDRAILENLSSKERRKSYYSWVSLQDENLTNLKEYQEYLKFTTGDFLNFIELNEKNLVEPLGTILYELIDNIRKHTNQDTDGFFSFYRTKIAKDDYEYQIVIADNGTDGLLNKYLQELKKEFKRLNKLDIEKNLLKDYICTIYYLKKHDQEIDKKVLNKLYNLSKITHTHQIPRVAMHFGIPMLLKMIDVFVEENYNKNILEVYTHRDNNYYKIAYNKSGKFIESKKQNHSIKGTYIILTFTSRISPYNDKILNEERDINSSIKSQDYKKIFEKREEIKNKINKFEVININDIEDFQNKETASKNIIINTQKNFKNTFSEFIRALYQYAYKHNIVDIVVININFTDFFSHLKLLAYILYNNIDKPYDKPRNILFYNESFPSSAFIGGKTKNEFLSIARTLSSYYGTNSYLDIFSEEDLKSKKDTEQKIESNLIYKSFILPFELFELTDENLEKINLLQLMLNSYLNKIANKHNIHVDTGVGYHINKFMEFKKVFEDSRWVKRLAFRLAIYFPNPKSQQYYLYGTDKYTNMLISLCYTFLGLETFDNFQYKLFNIHDDNEFDKLDKELENNKNTEYQKFLISSVVFNAKKITELAKKYDIKTISAIRLIIGDGQPNNTISLVDVKNNEDFFKIEDKYCVFCDSTRKIPLLKLLKDDPLFIQDTFFEPQPKKKIVSFSNSKNIQIKWVNSIHFGHIKRGNNHFLYYINTIKFFNENKYEIKNFLSNDAFKQIKYNKNKRENIILFTSSHDTNNNFIALVNQIVFDNEAIVLSSNISRGEANFHEIQSYQHFDWEKTRVFFVDDSIASTHTLKYFYQLYRTITGKETGLDGIIIMIDRISSYDETILQQYLSNKKIENIFAFATFNIKPIKTDVEKCFLCTRRDNYIELAKNSALDLTTFQMARRAYKLKKIDYKEIKSSKDKSLIEKFKTYLKAMATDYIYQNYAHKKDISDDFDNLLGNFTKQFDNNLTDEQQKDFKSCDKNLLKKIIIFQSEIALLKALSFPKLSYYYNIRKWAISIILSKLKTESEKTENQDFNLVYILKDTIEQSTLTREEKEFIDFYKSMTNLHLINVYFSLLGYFGDSKILNFEYIKFFYKITQNNDVRNTDHAFLHTYPFAVKFAIDDNLEKATYFEKNLNNLIKEELNKEKDKNNHNEKDKFKTLRKRKNSHIGALKIENTVYWKNKIETSKSINIKEKFNELENEKNIDESINKLKKLFEEILDSKKVYFFISPYATFKLKSYEEYLNNSEKNLINIFDSFNSISNYSQEMIDCVTKVFYGAIDVENSMEDNVVLTKVKSNNIIEKIDNTWANDFTNNYTVIRLINTDEKLLFFSEDKIQKNNPVWFKPIGCIVVENNDTDFSFHLKSARTILSIKRYIVKFIKNEFSHGIIQEKRQKNQLKNDYRNMIADIGHSVWEFLDFGKSINSFLQRPSSNKKNALIEYLEKLQIYSWGLQLNAKLPSLEKKDDQDLFNDDNKEKNINQIFYRNEQDSTCTEFCNNLKTFIKICSIFYNKGCNKCDEETLKINNYGTFKINLKLEVSKILFFELILNSWKRIENEISPKINIDIYDNKIEICNTCSDETRCIKYLEMIKSAIQGEGKRIGVPLLTKIFKRSKCSVNSEYNKESKLIKIIIQKEKLYK